MTAIPPVEVRRIRGCNECGFKVHMYDEDGDPDSICLLERYHFSKHCDSNFTLEEINSVLDQHNAGEIPAERI